MQNQFKGQTTNGHKAAEVVAWNACITTDTILWMFDNFLGTYMCKDGLLTIAGALQSDCRS